MKNCVICWRPVATLAWKLTKSVLPNGGAREDAMSKDECYACPECVEKARRDYQAANEPAGMRFQREMNEKYGSRA